MLRVADLFTSGVKTLFSGRLFGTAESRALTTSIYQTVASPFAQFAFRK
jgi:hypothetical protein